MQNRRCKPIYQYCLTGRAGPPERGLLDQSDRRPGDMSIPFWTSGRDTALNIVVINPIQSNLLIKAASTPGAAAEHAQQSKLRKNYEDCRRIGIEFIPIAVETWGWWHPRALSIIKKLSRHLGKEESEVHRHLRQRLSVLLQRGNVALLSSRVPDFTPNQLPLRSMAMTISLIKAQQSDRLIRTRSQLMLMIWNTPETGPSPR